MATDILIALTEWLQEEDMRLRELQDYLSEYTATRDTPYEWDEVRCAYEVLYMDGGWAHFSSAAADTAA